MSIDTNVRSLSFDDKVAYFKTVFADPNAETITEVDILNVYRLINSYNVFDDTFFNDERSYITDIAEFIDIKVALDYEINKFSLELVHWYLSILASCDIKSDDDPESGEDLPKLVCGFFAAATIPVMSAVMHSVDLTQLDLSQLQKVRGGFNILSKLFQTQAFVSSMLKPFLGF